MSVSAAEAVALLRDGNPHLRFAVYSGDSAVGVWDEISKTWRAFIAKITPDRWANADPTAVWPQDKWTPCV